MKRPTGVVLAMLLTVSLWLTPMAARALEVAAGPVVTSPANGAVIDVGLVQVDVDFSDAQVLEEEYFVAIEAANGQVIDSRPYDWNGSNPQATFALGPVTDPGDYRVRVLAENGGMFAETHFVAVGTPEAPNQVRSTSGSHEATLSWQPPTNDGGSPVTGYQVQLDDFASTQRDLAPVAQSFRFADLANGRTYQLYVRAQNAIGYGPWASASAVPAGRPAPPASPRATARSHRATLRWTYTSGDDEGASLIRYQVQRGTRAATRRNLPPSIRSHRFTRLANGTTYRFFVRAQNSVGFSRWVSATVTPARRPSAPARAHATASSHRARLYWGYRPGGSGGAAITGYQVQRGSSVASRTTRSRTARSHRFTGLTNGRVYTLYVRARNHVGYGPWARATARPHGARPQGTPLPPPMDYANCEALTRVYPHGVGRPGAVDRGGSVTNFTRDRRTYNLNTESDRDNDGIACER